MAFGWSAGDILAALKFIIDVAQALDDVNGAPKEFRQASSFLRNLDKALAPLRTFTALEARPEYKADIESEVQAIRTPIEAFMKDVEGMAKRLGDPGISKTGRFRIFRNIGSKLEWHYSTSKKAIGLQKAVEDHLRIIDTLMQRLTVDMLHSLQKDMKGNIQESVNTVFNTHLSPLKSSIVAEISQHDDLSRSTWLEQLEEIFERYLGSQRVVFIPSSSPSLPPQYHPTDSGKREKTPGYTNYTSEMMKENAAKVKSLLLPVFSDSIPDNTGGITADLEITHQLRFWWTTASSDLLWIHGFARDTQTDTSSLVSDVVAIAREAKFPVLWYVCKRLDPSGIEIKQTELFVDLVYSLVHQVLQSIHYSFASEMDFSASRFDLLKKSPPSITEALSILDDLIQINQDVSARNVLLIVLDGLQLLDYSNDSSLELHIREFLSILQGNVSKLSAPVIKSLIVTEEQTAFLLNNVDPGRAVNGSREIGSDGFISLAEFQERGTK